LASGRLLELKREFEILDTKVLEPYEKDHVMFLRRKGGL